MPAASTLRARWERDVWCGGDEHALDHLELNFYVDSHFTIRPRSADYVPTEEDESAIDYLFYEWDYCYSPEPARLAEGTKPA